MFDNKNWYQCNINGSYFDTLPTPDYCSDVAFTAKMCRMIINSIKSKMIENGSELTIFQRDKVVINLDNIKKFDSWLYDNGYEGYY